MPGYTVREIVLYEVDAEDGDAAMEEIIQAPDVNVYFVAVEHREAELIGGES